MKKIFFIILIQIIYIFGYPNKISAQEIIKTDSTFTDIVNISNDYLEIDGFRTINSFNMVIPADADVASQDGITIIRKEVASDDFFIVRSTASGLNFLTGYADEFVSEDEELKVNGISWQLIKVTWQDGAYEWYLYTTSEDLDFGLQFVFPKKNREEYIKVAYEMLDSFKIGEYRPAVLSLSSKAVPMKRTEQDIFEELGKLPIVGLGLLVATAVGMYALYKKNI